MAEALVDLIAKETAGTSVLSVHEQVQLREQLRKLVVDMRALQGLVSPQGAGLTQNVQYVTYTIGQAQFLALAADSALTKERIFTPGGGLVGSDGGAGGAYTLSVSPGPGIEISSSLVAVRAGDGIVLTNNKVNVSAGDGISVSSGAVDVVAGNGITVGASVAVDQSYQFNWTAMHTFASSIQSPYFASQTTGWRITVTGEIDARYIYTDEMHAKIFIAELEQAIAGSQRVTPGVAELRFDFVVPAPGYTEDLTVNDLSSAPGMAVFQDGDIVELRQYSRAGGSLAVASCWGVVTDFVSYSGYQKWTFTRSASPNSGTATTGSTVSEGTPALGYGQTKGGYYEVTTVDGAYGSNSPYWQIVSWVTHPASSGNRAVRLRGGNLYGITSVANEFGLYVGDGGILAANTFLRMSAVQGGTSYFELHNVPIKLYDGTANTVSIQADGDCFFGSLITSAATTSLAIFSRALGQTYNSESMGAGDILFGCNSSGYANILWDRSDKSLKFRGGTTTKLFIHTDGALYTGSAVATTGSQIKLSADGLYLYASSTLLSTDPKFYFATFGGVTYGSLYGYTTSVSPYDSYGYFDIYGTSSGNDGKIYLRAYNGTYASPGDVVQLYLDSTTSSVNMTGYGTYVQFRVKGAATATKDVMFVDTTSNEEWALSMRTHAETGENPFKLYYYSGSAWSAVQTWYKGGAVGIGTETPACKLDVAGTIRATGYDVPSSGEGVEIYVHTSGHGVISMYDRDSDAGGKLLIRGLPTLITTPISDPGASAMLRYASLFGTISPYLDKTNNRLYFRVKYDNDTDKTGYISLS